MSDTETKDIKDDVEMGEPAPADAEGSNGAANGDEKPVKPKSGSKAPVSKKSNGAGPSSKRKSTGVKPTEGNQKYSVGDVVLTKIRGFPAWPSMIVDPNDVPAAVLSEKPSGSGVYCSMFFPVGDYAWPKAAEIKPLVNHEITAYLQAPNKKTSGDLYKAYTVAEDPTDWKAEKDEERREAEALAAGQDELEEEDGEVEDEGAETGKKRKRGAEKKTEKKAKKAKVEKPAKAKKSEETVEEEDEIAEEPAPKKKEPKPKANKKKDAEAAAAAEEPAEGANPLDSDPEALKVRDWRHKLQRAFLNKGVPPVEDMDTQDATLKDIENYDQMTVAYLAYSKIGKVLKKISAMEGIPRNDELKFTERVTTLINKFSTIMNQAAGEGAE